MGFDMMLLDDNHQATKMVENYDSLIWTERFNTIGDFQITTGDVDTFMNLLPEGQVIALRDSDVPMIVETHLIERKKNQPVKLTIKGRDFCSILDRRIVASQTPGTGEFSYTGKTPADAAFFAIDEICKGEYFGPEDTFPDSVVMFDWPLYETSTGPSRSFVIPRGNLLSVIVPFLQASAPFDASTTPDTPEVLPTGIRAVRPDQLNTYVQVQFYNGTDKSDSVYFDATRDLLDDGSYLFSKVGSANAAFLLGSTSAEFLELDTPATGLERRVILVDGSQSKMDQAAMLEQGKISMADAHVTAMFDGSLNEDLNPYRYGTHYNLGDIVKLVGDYGLSGKARVTEFIRSEDATGVKAYPTLVKIED